MGQTISSTTRTEQPITVAPLQNNTHLTVEDVTHSPSPTTEALRVQPNFDHSNSSSSTPSPSRISSNYEFINLTPTLSRTPSRQSIANMDTPSTPTMPQHAEKSSIGIINPVVPPDLTVSAPLNPTNLHTDGLQSSHVDYECKYSHDTLPTVALTTDEEEEKYSVADGQPSYSTRHYNCIAPDHPGLPCYDEEFDDMLEEYFQLDAYEREYDDMDISDFPLRQRLRSKLLATGRRITIKSRITRKQRKHEKELVGQQTRTFKEKHKEELDTNTTLASFIHHRSENSNQQHVPFPDHMSNYRDIQVYMVSRYSNELMKLFHTGPTEVISITSATREDASDDELYFNPEECEFIPLLHPTLHCEMSYEGYIQQYGMTFTERLKQLPSAARAKLDPHHPAYQPHTAEQCQNSCQKKSTKHSYSLTDGSVRQLLKDCSTPAWITVSNESGQPQHISSDIHTLHFRVAQVAPNYTSPVSWNILMMEVTYRVNRLHHYKNSPCRQPELKLHSRNLSRHQKLALAMKRRHKRQDCNRDEQVNYAPRFSQQPYSAYEHGLARCNSPIEVFEDGEYEDTVDDVCSDCGEEIWNVGVRHVCWYRRDLEEYYLDKWRRLQEEMRREDEDNRRIEVYERDVVRVKVQPPRMTSCVNQVPRYDAFGTRTNIGPTQANKTIITYDTVCTQPTRTRHRQQLGVPRGGKKTRKEMKGLKLLYNQKRNEMTQEMKSKPAPTLMLDVPKQPSKSKYSLDRHQFDNSVKKKNRPSRSSKKTESKKAPPSLPTCPRVSSKPQPIPRGNAFKNQTIQTKPKINLSDLNKQMLVNAAKVEAGELEFIIKKKAGATNPFSLPRPTKRQYLTLSTNRVRHRYVTKQMPFHIGTNEIRQFQLAFYQLFRTEIEKALHSIQAGTRMISVRPYDLNADEPHYRTGFQTPQHRFMVALLSRLNDHQPSSRNPSHTQLDLRFSPVRSCVYAATVHPHQVISELATYLPCASSTESLVALRKKLYPLHTRGRCRVHCQHHSRGGYAQYQRECYSKENLKHLFARDCGPPLLTEVNHPHWPTGGSERLYEQRVAAETTVTDRHQYPFTYQHPFHPLQPQPYRRLVVSAAINGPERQVGQRLFSELMLPCVEIEYELVTPPPVAHGQFKSKEFRTQLHQAQQAARASHTTRRHSFKNELRSRLQSKCDPRHHYSTHHEFYYDYEPDESLYRPGSWSQYYCLCNESTPSINERVRTFLERTDQLFSRQGIAS